jgi:integral membrane sensor domain MASE1/DNA-binding CsgD family transcriptional regulator/PAS domain-containing protein
MRCPNKSSGNGRGPPRTLPLGSDVVALILVGLAYFTFAYIGLRFASVNSSATPIWPPKGLAIAAMLLWGPRIAPAIFVAAFLVNQLTAGSIFTSLAIAAGNTLEAVIAGYLVGYWAKGEQIFDTPTGTIKFALISVAATAVSATIGVSSLTLAGYADVSVSISVWLTWWLGDLAGALVVTPVVVLWAKSDPASLKAPRITKTGLLYLAAAAVGAIAFSPLLQQTTLRDALVFIVILPLLWASLRDGPRDTATITLIISAFVVWCTEMQCGPFSKPNPNDSLMLSLAFMITTAVPFLALSTDVAMRYRIENQEKRHALETEVLWQCRDQAAFNGSFDDLLRGCLERICRVTGWPVGHICLPDDDPRLLGNQVWHFEREELAALAHETAGNGLAIGGEIEWLPKTSESANEPGMPIILKPKKQILRKHGLGAAFGFPLYAEGKLQAIFAFFSITSQPPDKHLLYVVQSIGEQLGRVLERQRSQKLQCQAMAIADALSLATIRSEALQETLNALTSAIYLTDRHGRIVYMNRAAERQVGTGNAISVKNNHLTHIDHTAQFKLARAIDEAIGDDVDLPINGRTIALLGGDNAGLIATIFPLGRCESQGSCGASRMAAIFVQEPIAMPFSGGEAFAELYCLTRSELRVLVAMAPGFSVREAADTLGISENTAKTHLQHIYSKTNTSKRAELMQLFMSSTPPVKSA